MTIHFHYQTKEILHFHNQSKNLSNSRANTVGYMNLQAHAAVDHWNQESFVPNVGRRRLNESTKWLSLPVITYYKSVPTLFERKRKEIFTLKVSNKPLELTHWRAQVVNT